MAKLAHMESRRMYSWWWDSHISPKNSKWLQENLTGMDAKVKAMIKLIEEDADSFARRAEMYYKKRPELMKMVEEFYRAYRALAERYDHATGVIRHAHRTMSEAFPNQVPSMFADDSPSGPASGGDARLLEMSTPIGESVDESDSISSRKKDPFGHARRELNFDEMEEKKHGMHNNQNNHDKDPNTSKPNQETDEIQKLKEALIKLEAEKEAGLAQYQETLDKLSQLQSEISKVNEDYRVLRDHANNAEQEAAVLKEAMTKLEVEKESKLQDYQQCVDKISNLQTVISTAQEDAQKYNERASTAENEVQSLKGEVDKLAVEKEEALNKYVQSLETMSNLENKLQLTEEDARRLKERAEKAESEVETLRQTILKLTEEKDAASLEYQQCLETISSLENKLTAAHEEAKRLNVEVGNGAMKLKGAEERCLRLESSNQSLHSELESLMFKMGNQTQELTEKQKELGRLWACIQEERLRFVEAETAFQTLQHLHAQTQEELRGMASELQNRTQLLKVMETQNNSLQDEVLKVKQENKHLNEVNASSALSIKDVQNEISSLMESKGKLQEEVGLRLDERNALQQEIYCLKEELNDVNTKHGAILDQVHSAGLNPESLESSMKELQNENASLKDTCQRDSSEKAALVVKLEKLLEKNSLLETSLSDLNAELEAVRGKLEALEQSCQSLLQEKSALDDEKASLTAQLQETKQTLEKLSDHNTVLENFIAAAHHQLEVLKAKSKTLEHSCQLLVSEKSSLISANDGLSAQLANTNVRLAELGKLYGELEGRCVALENEKMGLISTNDGLTARLENTNLRLADLGKLYEELEGRYVALENEKTGLISTNDGLSAQLENTNLRLADLGKLYEEREAVCGALENEKTGLISSNDGLTAQLENTKVRLADLGKLYGEQEGRYAALENEKTVLISSNDGLNTQLENTNLRLADLGKLYGELEGRCETLEKEKESTLCKVEELQKSLEVERQEHANYVQMNATQFSGIETEMSLLKEESKYRKRELDQVLDNALVNEMEIFVLRVFLKELKENNCVLSIKNQKLLGESILSEKKISELEQNNFEQQVEIKSLSDQIGRLKAGTYKLVKALNLVNDYVHGDNAEQDQIYFNQLLSRLHAMELSLREAEEENLDLTVELSVFITWLRQLKMESINLEVEKNIIDNDLKVKIQQVLGLQSEALALNEVNEELRSKLREGDCKQEAMETQVKDLSQKLMEVQGTCQVLQREKLEICKEKVSLKNDILHLEEANSSLEEENYGLCDKVLAVENLSLMFRTFADEKNMEFRELGNDRNKLHEMNTGLAANLRSTKGSLEESKSENDQLKERLQKTEDELKAIAAVKDQFTLEIKNGKKQVAEMSLELQRAEEKINLVEKEKLELSGSVEDLRYKYDEIKVVRDEQENQILKLSADNDHLSRNSNCLREACQKLEIELCELQDEHDKRRIHELNLHAELQDKREELAMMSLELQKAEEKINLVEKDKLQLNESVEDLRNKYDEVKFTRDEQENQILELSAANEHLNGDRNCLSAACQKLEVELYELQDKHYKRRIKEENLHVELQNKQNKIDELETQAASLLGQLQYSMISQLLHEQKFHEIHEVCLGYMDQNEDLKTQLAAYGPEIAELQECISSLERHTHTRIRFQNPENEELQGAEVTSDPLEVIVNEDRKASKPSMIADLHDLRVRLQAIVKAAVEIKERMVQEKIDLHSKLDASTRQLELLQSESAQYRRNRRPPSEITEADNALLTKDIVLDQISNGSSYRFSKKAPVDAANQIIELWETGDHDGTVGMTVSKSKKIISPSAADNTDSRRVRSVKKQKGGHATSDSMVKEDFSMDKLENSKRSTDPVAEGNRRKVLERLDSDVQKLANLQITVQDLKRKLEVTEKSKRGKAVIQCEALKGQLEEADIAIIKLFDLNARLMKNIDDRSFSDTKSSSFEIEEDGVAKRKKISEQARRMSEKIGRLQLEVQKLQFVLLKLDDEKEVRSKMLEARRRILLRDYLYGGGRTGQRRKKTAFCACVQPSTVED